MTRKSALILRPLRASSARRVAAGLSLLALLPASALAQTQDDARAQTVSWAASVKPDGAAAKSWTLTLQAQVRDGWHVYALKQLPGGPTPLLVTLDPNKVATAIGEPAGSPPTKIHDPGFDLDTQYYSHAFTVSLPLRIASQPGRQQIPVSVRFQTCNDRVCQPPKIVHLSAPIAVIKE